MKQYLALEARSNIKGEDDIYRFYIEPVEGGGIEYIADSIEEAEQWCKENNGVLVYTI